MRFDRVVLVARKDWKDVFSSKFMLLSLLAIHMVPTLIPLFMISLITIYGTDPAKFLSPSELEAIRKALPVVWPLNAVQIFIYMVSVILLPALYLIFSVASTSIITADSFAGERERKTIEPLLATPITDVELFLGKLVASLIPSLILAYSFFLISALIINLMSLKVFGYFWYPTIEVILIMALLLPLYAFLGMSLVIWGSSRAKSVREASNYAGILVIPVIALLVGVMIGALTIGPVQIILFALILFMIDILIFYISYKTFNREKLVVV